MPPNLTPNTSSLSHLLKELLRVFQECIRYGRICLKTIANKCLNILKWFGSKLVDLTDNEQFWKYAKLIPLINTIFGSARVIRNIISGNWQEVIKSGLYAVGGIAAILIPIYLGVGCMLAFLLCPLINNVIGGFGSFIVDMCSDESLRIAQWSDMEDVLYERVIKVTPLIGAGYCPIRALVYLIGYNDKRQAKASAKDFIINIAAIAIAWVVFQYFDCSQLIGLIEENMGSTQNGFVLVVLNIIKKSLSSNVFKRSAAQCSNVGPQIVRDSSLLREGGFPYYEPNEAKFIQCLQRPYDFIRDNSDNTYMKSQLIQYVVKCLVAGYKNITNEQGNGESALELAFQGRDPAVLQAVIAFTPTLLERRGQRSSIIIDGMLKENDSVSNRCVKYILSRACLQPSELIEDHINCCDAHPQYKVVWRKPTVPRPMGPFNNDGKRVLTIDGGGTRGVVSLEILRQLEKLCFADKICECFDLIVGTSTGGIIALLIADGHRVEEIQKFYFELKDRVFCGRKGNVSEFERLLKDMFEDRVMGSIPNSTRVVITASLMQNNELKRKVFTNFDEESSAVPIWMVARCTAAAPGYFPPFEHNGELLLDGGLIDNNPVFVAFQQLRGQLENSTIVSIGTGIYSEVSNQRLNVSKSTPGQVRMAFDGSLRQFVYLLVNQVTRTDSDIVEDAMLMCEQSRAHLYRLNPILPEKVELDETDDEKLVNAIWHTKVFARNYLGVLQKIAERLID